MTYPGAPERPQPRFIPAAEPPVRPTVAQPVISTRSPIAARPIPPQPGPPQPPRQKSHWVRNILLGVAAFAVGVAAVAVYKGDLSVSTLTGKTAKPLTCAQQYAKWKTGPAQAEGKKMEAALTTVEHANDDIVTINTGLKQAGAAAAQLESEPMPACVDPGGYWAQTLADIKASGDNAGSASGLAALIAAEVPLKNVPALETKLQTELKSTTK